jgi:hypothetical protein
MVNEHVLFDIVFNTAIRNMKTSIKRIDNILNESCKNISCCISCESEYRNGDCEISIESSTSARGYVEHKVEEYKRIHECKKANVNKPIERK